MKAELHTEFSLEIADGAFAACVIWRVPKSLRGSLHEYKYRAVLVVDDKPVLRYDNEAGKGDHRHLGSREYPYDFRGPDDLLVDFWEDVRKWLKQHGR